MNHLYDPNSHEYHRKNKVYIVVLRDINVQEEVTFDYDINTSGGDSWISNCGSKRCRGETIGDYFKLPKSVQIEFRSQLGDWFIKKFAYKILKLENEIEQRE